MAALDDDEKIAVRKVRLVRLGQQAFAVVGTLAVADELLDQWRSATQGQFRCRFEIEYVDEHVVTGEYRSLRPKTRRVTLSAHVRATYRKMLKRIDMRSAARGMSDCDIQFWHHSCAWPLKADFLERYEN